MKMFLLNLILALIWRIALGEEGFGHIIMGFVISYFILWWLQPLLGRSEYFRRLPMAIMFALFFLRELVKSNMLVARDVVTPGRGYRRPAFVAVPLDVKTDFQITLLANLITLTPGTLSMDVSDDRSTLYIHAMFVDDPQAFRREIKEGFERRVLELMA
jgi:multicomponent Na+:H+ antiporter subunit E